MRLNWNGIELHLSHRRGRAEGAVRVTVFVRVAAPHPARFAADLSPSQVGLADLRHHDAQRGKPGCGER